MADIVRGRYRHFKGGVYIVLGTATHSETEEELVIYHKATSGLFVSDEERKLWARPAKMWNETVFRHGSEKQRFELLNNIPAADVVERKSARWKGAGLGDYYCSLCNETYSIGAERVNDWHFCPNCGADMRPDPLKEVDGTKL